MNKIQLGSCRAVMIAIALGLGMFFPAGPAKALGIVALDNAPGRISLAGAAELVGPLERPIALSSSALQGGVSFEPVILPEKYEDGTTAYWVITAFKNPSDTAIQGTLEVTRPDKNVFSLIWPGEAREPQFKTIRSNHIIHQAKSLRYGDQINFTIPPEDILVIALGLQRPVMPELTVQVSMSTDSLKNQFVYEGVVLGICVFVLIMLAIICVFRSNRFMFLLCIFALAVSMFELVSFGYLRGPPWLAALTSGLAAAAFSLFWSLFLLTAAEGWQRALGLGLAVLAMLVAALAALHANSGHVGLTIVWAGSILSGLYCALMEARKGASHGWLLLPAFGVWTMALIVATAGAVAIFPTPMFIENGLHGAVVLATLLTVLAGLPMSDMLLDNAADHTSRRPRQSAPAPESSITTRLADMPPAVRGAPVQKAPIAQPDIYQKVPVAQSDMYQKALEGAGAGMWTWEPNSKQLTIALAPSYLASLKKGGFEGTLDDFLKLIHAAERNFVQMELTVNQPVPSSTLNLKIRMAHENGTYRWIAMTASWHEQVKRFVGILRDITDQKISEDQLISGIFQDWLTGLASRSFLMQALGSALKRATTRPGTDPALMLIYLDHHEQINEGFGRTSGDIFLIEAAKRLKSVIGDSQTVARISGPLYALSIEGGNDHEQVMELADNLLTILSEPFLIESGEVRSAVAIGIAFSNAMTKSAKTLWREAELAYYEARRQDDQRIVVFNDQLLQRGNSRLTLASELKAALDNRELDVHYQSIIRVATGAIAGFEALVRWNHPQHGMIEPDEFVAIAEENNLVEQLGQFVLETAARQLSSWQRMYPSQPPLFVSVNVSSRQLLRHTLIEDFRNVLARNDIAPNTLKLEVTESLLMQNPEQAARVLTELKESGAGLALDDFGTGYSSLGYLRRFPFDILKTDRCFAANMLDNKKDKAIVRAVIDLAHQLDMQVVIEGVEGEDVATVLKEMGGDFVQGYFFTRPMTAKEATTLLMRTTPTQTGA